MKEIFKKRNLVYLVVVVWLVFSVGYIVRDQWLRAQATNMQTAYQQGRADTIMTIMTEVEKCVPLPLFSDEKELNVVSVECLQESIESNKNPEE